MFMALEKPGKLGIFFSYFVATLYQLMLCCNRHPMATLWCHLHEHDVTDREVFWDSPPSDLKHYDISREQFVHGLKAWLFSCMYSKGALPRTVLGASINSLTA